MTTVDASFQLTLHRERFPELKSAESAARLELAAAIMQMDAVPDEPGRHDLHEQAAVEEALRAYGRALADLVRGEADSAADAGARS